MTRIRRRTAAAAFVLAALVHAGSGKLLRRWSLPRAQGECGRPVRPDVRPTARGLLVDTGERLQLMDWEGRLKDTPERTRPLPCPSDGSLKRPWSV